jgi:hypothetical protein
VNVDRISADAVAKVLFRACTIDPESSVINLSVLRNEWQRVAENEGVDLLDLQGPVGWILIDCVKALGVTGGNAWMILGERLYQAMLQVET